MLNVIVIGLGPIGVNAAAALSKDSRFNLVGLVDLATELQGKTLSQLLGEPGDNGSRVVASISSTLSARPRVAIVCTASHLDRIAPTLRDCAAAGLHVVSSCEQMSFPAFAHPDLSRELNDIATAAKVSMLGTGVNPGFVMDLLPLVLSSMLTEVTGVKVIRRLDAGKRRRPLQAKVGATMTREQFEYLARDGKIGHMGIGESVAMIAAGMGQEATRSEVKITLEPVIAQREIRSALGIIQPGQVCGMRNTANWANENLRIELDLTMAVGTEDAQDRVELAGPVPLTAIIPGSTSGDSATVAALVNCAAIAPLLPVGLRTMLDVPVAACGRKM